MVPVYMYSSFIHVPTPVTITYHMPQGAEQSRTRKPGIAGCEQEFFPTMIHASCFMLHGPKPFIHNRSVPR
jgi:hypothetical protein